MSTQSVGQQRWAEIQGLLGDAGASESPTGFLNFSIPELIHVDPSQSEGFDYSNPEASIDWLGQQPSWNWKYVRTLLIDYYTQHHTS